MNNWQNELLKSGVESWNLYRRENPNIEIDLTYANLKYASLSKANLQKADLRFANLMKADLKEADLKNSILTNSDLNGANLNGANLSAADLSYSDTRGTIFTRACFLNAILYDIDLSDQNFSGIEDDEVYLNQWGEDIREDIRNSINFGGANLSYANLSNVNLIGANLRNAIFTQTNLRDALLIRADLFNANLVKACLIGADLRNSNLSFSNLTQADLKFTKLRGANLFNVNLTEADLRHAKLFGADLTNANLKRCDLSNANLSKAKLINSNLNNSILVNAKINGSIITRSHIYGVNIWDLKGDFKEQKDLIITPPRKPEITVDNIKVAQFIYLILENDEIRNVINTLTSKTVLILGRFTDDRKEILNALKSKLRDFNLLPIVFDFSRPLDKNFTETIKTLASLSYFVIADITSPKSVPLELQALVPDFQIPFIPIIEEGEEPFSMFNDLPKSYDWVLDRLTYDSIGSLIEVIEPAIINPAIEKHNELRKRKASEPTIRKAKDFLL